MKFDSNSGIATSFQGRTIHTLNKNEVVLSDKQEYYAEAVKRPNVILLGDSLGDAGMSKGENVFLRSVSVFVHYKTNMNANTNTTQAQQTNKQQLQLTIKNANTNN